ncbi:MAG: tetratricopeptide repeat protein [Candidatus Omnitrophota bacterium]
MSSLKKSVKPAIFGLIITVLFFAALEGLCRMFVFPGSSDYIERRIIEHDLSQRKKAGEFRIFLYGESTMHGGALYPYSTIGKWVDMYLSDLLPEDAMRRVTIVNFGRMGAGSSFIARAFSETAAYKPDLTIFSLAHNDFCLVEHRLALISSKTLKDKFEDFCGMLPRKSSFLNLINRSLIRAKIKRNKAKDKRSRASDPWYDESDAPEAFRNEANLLRPGSPEFKLVAANFENNIEKIIGIARRRSIPVIFFEGLSRWKDYEPIRPVHGSALTADKLRAWERSFALAEELFASGRYADALTAYNGCIAGDPSYALAYYRAAQCYEGIGEYKKANESYLLANDNDFFPIRAPSIVNRLYEDIRASGLKGVNVIPTQKLFEDRSLNGIVGGGLTIDQIHPSPEGQAIMALAVVEVIYGNGMIAPREKWRWGSLRSADAMKEELGLDKERAFNIHTGTASYLAKHYSQAAKSLEEALAIKPGSVFVRSWLAWTYWKMGETGKAVALYRSLYGEYPSPALAFLNRHADIKELVINGAAPSGDL